MTCLLKHQKLSFTSLHTVIRIMALKEEECQIMKFKVSINKRYNF